MIKYSHLESKSNKQMHKKKKSSPSRHYTHTPSLCSNQFQQQFHLVQAAQIVFGLSNSRGEEKRTREDRNIKLYLLSVHKPDTCGVEYTISDQFHILPANRAENN